MPQRKKARSFVSTAVLSMLLLLLCLPAAQAADWEKIPIEQAIEESHRAHEDCRMNKIRAFQKGQTAKQTLGALPTQYQYDVNYYDIKLDVDFDIQVIFGSVELVATATQDGVTFCEIDLYDNMTIDSLWANGAPTSYSFVNDLLTVDLPVTVDEGEQFSVTVFYHGTPISGGFLAFEFTTRLGEPVASTLSEPYFARSWWPCKDYPDDKADSVDIMVTYPSDLFCSSNGSMIYDIDNLDGTRSTHWSVRYPIPTYLVSLVITNFSHWREWWHYTEADSMPVDFWAFPDKFSAAQSGWAPTLDMLDTLSDRFGLYPFTNEKYAMSMFTWGGGMEHQTNTSMGSSATYQSITVHELGHQWWGDMITCEDWGHIWLNEGFASYTEALWFESLGGFEDLRSYMNGMRYTSGGTIYCQDTTGVWSIFSSRVYDKGAWVLHMLRHELGDAVFFDALHAYYDDPVLKFAHASTEDFRDVCEAVSGRDLDEFFDDWIYGTYYPIYVTSFTYDEITSDSFVVYAQVRQNQSTSPAVFDFEAADLSVQCGGVWHDFTRSMNQRTQDYVLHVGGATGAPTDFTIDRNDWILKTVSSEGYDVHIIYDTLTAGEQSIAYEDSVIVRGGGQPYSYQLTSGSLPAGLSLDSGSGVISGTPSEFGSFAFTVTVQDFGSDSDSEDFLLEIAEAQYVPGDANGDSIANITDAVALIDFVFNGGPAPVPFAAGDANGDCLVNITDAVYLIAYIFAGGPAPVAGCA